MEEIVGTTIVDGMRLGHTLHEVEVIKAIVARYQPEYFVEIGVHEGVLSKLLIEAFGGKPYYIGVEVNCQIVKTKPYFAHPYRAELICADCFSESVRHRIRNLHGRKIVYCDGGNKAKELVEYAPLVFTDDILMAHDFDDGTRRGMGLPENILPEVRPADIAFLSDGFFFGALPNIDLSATRIVAYECYY